MWKKTCFFKLNEENQRKRKMEKSREKSYWQERERVHVHSYKQQVGERHTTTTKKVHHPAKCLYNKLAEIKFRIAFSFCFE